MLGALPRLRVLLLWHELRGAGQLDMEPYLLDAHRERPDCFSIVGPDEPTGAFLPASCERVWVEADLGFDRARCIEDAKQRA